MLGSAKLTGIVLTAMPIGEYDRRLTILTKEKGRVTAFVKGARKAKSSMTACSQPFVFAEFTVYRGRDAYNILSADKVNYFEELRERIESVYYGFYFCELAGFFTRENNQETEMLKLLYQTLRALTKESLEPRLIRAIFELKAIYLNGEGPEVFSCVHCKSNGHLRYFDFFKGGLACEDCNRKNASLLKLIDSTIYTLQYILSSKVEKLYTFRVSEEVQGELEALLVDYRRLHIDREMKSEEMLNLL